MCGPDDFNPFSKTPALSWSGVWTERLACKGRQLSCQVGGSLGRLFDFQKVFAQIAVVRKPAVSGYSSSGGLTFLKNSPNSPALTASAAVASQIGATAETLCTR